MSDRTLDSVQAAEAIRRPSFEMQQAALAAGFGSVRDWALAQCVDEIRALRQRVDALEGKRGGERHARTWLLDDGDDDA